MAMKFWFGKKEEDRTGGATSGSADVLSIPDISKDEEKGVVSFSLPSAVQQAPVAEKKAIEDFSLTGKERAPESRPPSADVVEKAPSIAEPGKSVSAAMEAPKVILRPLGAAAPAAPVRLAPVAPSGAVRLPAKVPSNLAAGGSPSVTPAATPVATPVAGHGGQVSGGGDAVTHPAFGLRPKGGVSGSVAAVAPELKPLAPLAENKENPIPSGDASAIRPKVDQRALYYELMNGLYDAVLILDDQGHVVDCNTRVEPVLGYTREEMWDLPINKVITGMSVQMFEHLRRNLAEHHHILIDARCFRKDGTSFAGEVGVSTLSLTRGKGNNLVFALRNVERRKNAMEELKKSQVALQVALVPAFVCDLEGAFLTVNQAFLDAFGIPDEAQAKSVRFIDLLPDAARVFLRASCGEKLRETVQVTTPSTVPVRIELSLMPVQSGQTVTAVAGSLLQL